MDGETSWISHTPRNTSEINVNTYSPDLSDDKESDNDDDNNDSVSADSILPDDILERILSCLPTASIVRAGCVCKRWNGIVGSDRFLWSFSPQKPWYFMFTSSTEALGHAYDPALKKWYCLDLPCVRAPNWLFASSRGLVVSMDNNDDTRSELCVVNPVTRRWKRLSDPPGMRFSDYSALAISTETETSNGYTVSVVKSKQFPESFFQWDVSIHVYDSISDSWVTSLTEVITGWRAGDESVICDGVLYFLIYSTGGGGNAAVESRHGLIRYDLSNNSGLSLIGSFVAVPCPLTCGRLMNLRGRLVMVGGIGKADRTDIIKGIGIWGLIRGGKEWREIARMPHKFFQGFGELDDVFASGGTDDVIYIQSYGAPALLMYDVAQRHWRWAQKCPVAKRFPLQLFTGFCFEPRLEIVP